MKRTCGRLPNNPIQRLLFLVMTRSNAFRVALLFPLWALVSCGHDGGGPGYYSYGFACRDDLDCGAGVGCVERQGGTCWPLCRSDVDCPALYACRSTARHNQSGKDDVCLPR